MVEKEKRVTTGVETPKSDNERILAEVRVQMAENERKNEAHFARMEDALKKNESSLQELKSLAKKNESMWKLCGITLGQDGGKNPFLFLEQLVPEAFKGMSTWAEKTKKAAIEEIELSGLDYGEVRKKAAKRKSGGGGLPSLVSAAENKSQDVAEYRAKKPMRRVKA